MLLDRPRLRAPSALAIVCCSVAGLWAPTVARAQAAGAATAPAAEMTPAERAQRDADKVFKWILIHSDKPRKAAAPHDDKPAVATVRAKPAARAAEPVVTSAPAASPATAAVAAPRAASAEPPLAAAQTAARPIAEAPTAAPLVATVARPGAESLAVPVSLTNSLESPASKAPSTPAAIAAEALEETLRPVFRADPQFSPNLLRTLRKGQVQVGFTVLPDGSVAEPQVLASSNARLNQAAMAAVAQWRFAPLKRAQAGRVDLGFDLD